MDHKTEYFDETNEDLSCCATKDILHDYKMLIEDFGPDDDLVAEMRSVLVSRHKYLAVDEAGDVPQDWRGAHFDTTKYHVSASLIFEVDEALYTHHGMDGLLFQKVPIGKDVIDSSTKYQYLIGLQLDWEDAIFCYIDEHVAAKIIDTILRAVPNGAA